MQYFVVFCHFVFVTLYPHAWRCIIRSPHSDPTGRKARGSQQTSRIIA
jgi:hypothetical protein